MINKEYINEHYANIEKSQKIIKEFSGYVKMAQELLNHSIEAIRKEIEKENAENGSKK